MQRVIQFLFVLVWASAYAQGTPGLADTRGTQFLGFDDFSKFSRSQNEPGELVLLSPEIPLQLKVNEIIPSWNIELSAGGHLEVELRAIYPDRATKFYAMGSWSGNTGNQKSRSFKDQKDDDGNVSTDTLRLTKGAEKVQIRLTLKSEAQSKLLLLGLCATDTSFTAEPLAPNQAAWGKTVEVPERSQMAYPNGKVLCSPTTVSMLLAYWSRQSKRPELDHDVPEIAKAIYDETWQGTGNWAFNMAYAGSCPGMQAFVTRMSDVAELEDWIAQGLPVGISVCYDRLRGKGPGPNGHLVVCVGFTKEGDVVINDPGTSKNVRKVFPRKNLQYAWAYSHNTAYVVYPKETVLPKDRFVHWTVGGQGAPKRQT
jgi:hypothetical protein